MTLNIKIPDVKSANRLNQAATEVKDTVWVHSKNGAIMVDARSLIGLYTLIGKEAMLVAEDDANPNSLVYIAKKAKIY